MLAIKFADAQKTTFEYRSAIETEEFYNGDYRRVLIVEFSKDQANVETLNDLCSEESNLARIELTNDEQEITNIYEGYVLKLKIGVEPVFLDDGAQKYEDRIVLKLGKRSFTEQLIADQKTALNTLGVEA